MFDFHCKDLYRKTAIIDAQGYSVTYEELNRRAAELSEVIERKSVILMLCDISIETASMYYYSLKLGIVPILMNPNANEEYIAEICEKYHPQYIWCKSDREVEEIGADTGLKFIEHRLFQTSYEEYAIYTELAAIDNLWFYREF